jgi:hypothetical protein
MKNKISYSVQDPKSPTWKAKTLYFFDTSSWHSAGAPTFNNERPVLNASLKPKYKEIVG